MKYAVAILALAATAAGCAAAAKPEEVKKVRDDLEKLEITVTNNNNLQAHLYDRVVDANRALTDKVAKMERLVMALEATIERLERQGPAAAAAPPVPVASPEGNKTAGASEERIPPATPPKKSIEDVLAESESSLAQLRERKATEEEVAARLRPYAKDAAPYLMGELRRAVTKVDFTKQIETVLSKFPAADLLVPLEKALGDRLIRLSSARIVGALRDKGLSRILEAHASSDDEDFRLAVGEALVRCRNVAGIPALVQSLRSAQTDTRIIAISTLKAVNRGQDFGYKAPLDADRNAAAIRAWEEWADKFGKTIFD